MRPSAGRTSPADARIVGLDGRAKAYRPLDEDARGRAREAGIATYERGRFWHAHELLEPAWMGSPDRAERDLDQGLIKLAAAYVHAERGNAAGMRTNLVGAQRRLTLVAREHGEAGRHAAAHARVDVDLLLERITGVLARLDELLAASAGTATREKPGDASLVARIPPPRIPRSGG